MSELNERHFSSNNKEKCKTEAEIHCFRMHTTSKIYNLISNFMKILGKPSPLTRELFKNYETWDAEKPLTSMSLSPAFSRPSWMAAPLGRMFFT